MLLSKANTLCSRSHPTCPSWKLFSPNFDLHIPCIINIFFFAGPYPMVYKHGVISAILKLKNAPVIHIHITFLSFILKHPPEVLILTLTSKRFNRIFIPTRESHLVKCNGQFLTFILLDFLAAFEAVDHKPSFKNPFLQSFHRYPNLHIFLYLHCTLIFSF